MWLAAFAKPATVTKARAKTRVARILELSTGRPPFGGSYDPGPVGLLDKARLWMLRRRENRLTYLQDSETGEVHFFVFYKKTRSHVLRQLQIPQFKNATVALWPDMALR